MEALPKEITDNIREILEGCRDGKLKHDQSWYHCGTAHCIAGWKSLLDYAKDRRNKNVLAADFAGGIHEKRLEDWCLKRSGGYESHYAQTAWKLTDAEAIVLFASRSTLRQQFALLKKLESGKRITEVKL